jgi:hypothetical protein
MLHNFQVDTASLSPQTYETKICSIVRLTTVVLNVKAHIDYYYYYYYHHHHYYHHHQQQQQHQSLVTGLLSLVLLLKQR